MCHVIDREARLSFEIMLQKMICSTFATISKNDKFHLNYKYEKEKKDIEGVIWDSHFPHERVV